MKRKRKGPRRRVVLGLADVHGGHTLGLLNPDAVLIRANAQTGEPERWRPELTATQMRLWRLYTQHLNAAAEFAGDDEIIVVHDGDLTWGMKHPNGSIAGITMDEQMVLGYYNLLPAVMLPQVQRVRLVSGTYSHVIDSAEAKVAYQLARHTKKDVTAFRHERMSVSGEVFDLAHHGPSPGIRDWLHGNVATIYLRDRVYRDRRLGKQPARVYMRGHFHDWVHVTFNECWQGQDCTADLTVLPSYSGLTWYATQVTQSIPSVTNGLCCYEVVNGELAAIRPFKETEDLRTEEIL